MNTNMQNRAYMLRTGQMKLQVKEVETVEETTVYPRLQEGTPYFIGDIVQYGGLLLEVSQEQLEDTCKGCYLVDGCSGNFFCCNENDGDVHIFTKYQKP